METLYLTDLLKKTDLDIKKVKLIRHAKSDAGFRKCYEAGFTKEYTQVQAKGFSKGYDYWIVFISDSGTSAVLEGCYKVKGHTSDTPDHMPAGFPASEMFDGTGAFFDLEETDYLKEYNGRLVIDWGKSARMWHQKATTEKEIIAIRAAKETSKPFPGFENLILSYNELKEIVDEPEIHSNWHAALSSVYGIYLIVDKVSGKQYVGSSYGYDGVLQRWSTYVHTKHGGNKLLKKLLSDHPDRYKHFQFSILQIIPMTMRDEDVIALESLYKNKLMTREFGLNDD